MTHAIRIETPGGPEVMKWQPVDVPAAGPGEIRVRHTAVGLNYIDTYHRSGLYPLDLPSGLGVEAAGVVTDTGDGVTDLKVGDRIAYATGPIGAYSEERVMPAAKAVALPDAVDEMTAAGAMLQGMTVQYLLRTTFRIEPGQTILFHAVAGGVGLIACQWAKALGVTVIGTAGSEEKAALARAHGCAHTILYREENVVERVMEITQGRGVPVVYDSVGQDTFEASLDCLAKRGMLVSFGQSSGPIAPQNLSIFASKGSLYFTRPTLFDYCLTRDELDQRASDLFAMIGSGKVKIKVNQTVPLRDAADAHRALESRATTGSTVLIP